MKYYVYISDTKIDMLYPQIPQPILKRIASSLSIDLKFLGAELSVAGKINPSDETRYAKVRIVSAYIEKHLDVGMVDAPRAYFKGTFLMRWGRLEKSDTIYFTGRSVKQNLPNPYSDFYTTLGLGGSLKHILGNTSTLPIQHPPEFHSPSAAPVLLKDLIDEIQSDSSPNQQVLSSRTQSNTLYAVSAMASHMKGPEQNFEFLARTLLQENYPNSRILLGTPIYLALAD